jgi:HEAT repeat protein
VWRSLLLALALLPGLAAPAVAQSAGSSPEITKHIADVVSADSAVQEAAAVALGKTGDRKILPLLEALREGSVYVRSLPGGKKETVIVGDKVSEGDKTLVPLFTAYGHEPIAGSDGKPLLAELSTLGEVSAGRSLRMAIRPLIDAFSGQNELASSDPAARRAAATKMAYTGDAATLKTLEEALPKESDRWVRFALE